MVVAEGRGSAIPARGENSTLPTTFMGVIRSPSRASNGVSRKPRQLSSAYSASSVHSLRGSIASSKAPMSAHGVAAQVGTVRGSLMTPSPSRLVYDSSRPARSTCLSASSKATLRSLRQLGRSVLTRRVTAKAASWIWSASS